MGLFMTAGLTPITNNGHKNGSGDMMTCFTTITTYDHIGRHQYGHKSRTTCRCWFCLSQLGVLPSCLDFNSQHSQQRPGWLGMLRIVKVFDQCFSTLAAWRRMDQPSQLCYAGGFWELVHSSSNSHDWENHGWRLCSHWRKILYFAKLLWGWPRKMLIIIQKILGVENLTNLPRFVPYHICNTILKICLHFKSTTYKVPGEETVRV